MRAAPLASFYLENFRWLSAGFALSFFSSFGQTFFISLFAGEIRAVHGLSDGAWGALYTVATLGSAAIIFQAGALADRVRLDRLACGVLGLYACAALGMAFAGSLLALGLSVFALRLCGQGMMSHLAMTSMGRWFRARRGRAVAFAGLGFSTGEAVLPTLAVIVIAAVGWRETWMLVAGLLALVAAPGMALLLSRGRAPAGMAAGESHPGRDGRHWTRGEVLRHWLFWALVPVLLTPPFVGTVMIFHQVHIAGVYGWPLADLALGFPAYAAVTVCAALFGGWVVDKVGPARLLPLFLIPCAGSAAVIAAGGGPWIWIGALALLGLTQGFAQTIWGSLWPELYGTRHLGAIRAVGTTAMVFSTAAGPGITGLLIDAGIDFPRQAAGLAAIVLAVAGLGFSCARRIEHTRPAA